MAFSDTILVSGTCFTDTEFSVIEYGARNLLTQVFCISETMSP